MKFLIMAGLFFVSACTGDPQTSLSVTANRFMDAFYIRADYAFAEPMTDSLAALKIRNHVAFQSLSPRDTVNRKISVNAGFDFCDSMIGDSAAFYTFRVQVTDPDVFLITETMGFVRLSRHCLQDWKVMDFGYFNRLDKE